MLIKTKTTIQTDFSWVHKLKFKEHADKDLSGYVDAIAIKSESGSVYDFYRSDPVEKPKNFKYTQLYDKIPEAKLLTDFYEIETTRIRIHKQDPGKTIPLHVDGNNSYAKTNEDYRLRMITALTSSVDFIYTFEYNNETIEYQLKDGESIIFDPDLVKHGMKNKSKTKTRYALVQVFKAYPVTEWMKNFINKKETVIL